MGHLLEVKHLQKTFGRQAQPVVHDVSFTVEMGEMLVLLGPSGCGKTTTLRMIGGFERADKGRITLQGRCIADPEQWTPPEHRDIGFVFQDYALFPHLSVEQNIGFGLHRWDKKKRKEQIQKMLELVGLTHLAKRMPHQLSGGEQQRIALARAMAPQPKLILLDEPFSNLDEQRRERMRLELKELLQTQEMSSILVTHHQEEALVMADRIAVMHQGTIQQLASPHTIYTAPQNAFVAQFMGQTNLIEGQATGAEAQTALGRVKLTHDVTDSIWLSIRPEQIQMHVIDTQKNIDESDRGVVRSAQFKGHHTLYQVEQGEVLYQVSTHSSPVFSVGTSVRLTTDATFHPITDAPNP